MKFSLSRWLRPHGRPCLICRKEFSRSSAFGSVPVRHPEAQAILGQLCGGCKQAIPWIGSPVCKTCGRPEFCPDCPRRTGRHFAFCRSAVRYDDAMKNLLALYKYRGSEKLEPLMAAMLAGAFERLAADLPENAGSALFHMITAVPLAQQRLEDRGFNQAERMAVALAGWYGVPCLPLLQRVRHTEKQSLKNRQSRLSDMKGTFSASTSHFPKVVPSGGLVRILLVDDIYTTGSTVNECAHVLKKAVSESLAVEPGRVEICAALWARS